MLVDGIVALELRVCNQSWMLKPSIANSLHQQTKKCGQNLRRFLTALYPRDVTNALLGLIL